MNATKAMTLLAAVAVGLSAQALTLAVKDVKIAQRYPWNGLVDIDYTVECDDPDADVYVYPVGYDADMNMSVALFSLTGEGANGKTVKAGTHRMTWDMAKDMGANYNRAKFSVKMHAYSGAAPYLVVSLNENGLGKYEISYLNEVTDKVWGQEYKGDKIVLRLITPGTFTMGAQDDECGKNYAGGRGQQANYETLHQVKITKPFYVGVFEVTQRQYEMVMGENPSSYKGAYRPVECVSYEMIRGRSNGSQWPKHRQVDADTFIGRLRDKTGMTFDIPTEAQWEYACRAGTSTALNSGKNLSAEQICPEMNEVGRYYGNRTDGKGGYGEHTEVGSYKPNAWGLYDMHGNVFEWCLDWLDIMSAAPSTDPVGSSSGSYRLARGGGWYNSYFGYHDFAAVCRSAYRCPYNYYGNSAQYTTPSYKTSSYGFRVVCVPAE